VTGVNGQIGLPLAASLVERGHEVWGIARFRRPESRQRVEAAGINVIAGDLAGGDLSEAPDDFTHVVHLAAEMGDDYDEALRVNAEGTGLLLHHCRRARAALVMSTHSVYKPSLDPDHVFVESDPLGDSFATHAPTYSISKIAGEGVARACARMFDLPVTIARMNASYGDNGGLPAYHVDAVLAGRPISVRWDPYRYSLMHQDDINGQVEALLDAATVPATIVNWAGDEPVSVQEYVAYAAEIAGVDVPPIEVAEQANTLRGSIASNERRLAITGPCRVGWREGIRRVVASRQALAARA
jgi:nucleoside-diphosphate-sugar epimerase